jgi:hypothetical protein
MGIGDFSSIKQLPIKGTGPLHMPFVQAACGFLNMDHINSLVKE